MSSLRAYCTYCETVTDGKVTRIKMLESGNYIHFGECGICSYEIKRIVPRAKEILEDL